MIGVINRKRFFDLWRERLTTGENSQEEVANLTEILDRAEKDNRLTIPLLSSMIATARWETRRFERLQEMGSDAYLRQYQGRGGNNSPGDYKKFRGHGWVHLTFRDMYAKMERYLLSRGIDCRIVENPEALVENADANYEVMVGGSLEGLFTGKRLTDYISDGSANYLRARMVINPGELKIAQGLIKASAQRRAQCQAAVNTIVKWSKEIEAILRLSATPSDAEQIAQENFRNDNTPAATRSYDIPSTAASIEIGADEDTEPDSAPEPEAQAAQTTGVEKMVEKEGTAPASANATAPAPPAPSTEPQNLPSGVSPPVPATQGDFIQASVGGLSRIKAVQAATGLSFGTVFGGFVAFFTWAKNNPTDAIAVLTLIAIAITGIVWLAHKYLEATKELDTLRMQSAMRKDLNTVR